MAANILGDTSGNILHQNTLFDHIEAKTANKLIEKARKNQRQLLEKAKLHHERDEWREALKYYHQAWQADEKNLQLLTLVAYCLVQLDARVEAMDMIERAIQIHGVNEILCQMLGLLAMKMHFHDVAEKLWRQAINLNPKNPENYINFLGTLYELGRFDDIVAYAQEILPLFPNSSGIWNILATAVGYTKDGAAAPSFFEEALRLDPKNIRVLNNYALYCRMSDKGLELSEKAVAIAPDNPELNVGLAFHYLWRGRLKEAWPHYEYRLNPNRAKGQNLRFMLDLKRWHGQIDKNLTLFVANEQGIGDEVLFLRSIPFLQERVGHLIVGCNARLATIIERSFPQVAAVVSVDKDHAGYIYRHYPALEGLMQERGLEKEAMAFVPLASSWQYFWQDREEISAASHGYFKPDPERQEKWRQRLAALGEGPKIGLFWKSGHISAQRTHYPYIEGFAPLLQQKNIHLICLQYGEVKEDIAWAKEHHGATIHVWDDFDIKMDIENNIALMSVLDMSIGTISAPLMFGAACGASMHTVLHGRPWWMFGYPKTLKELPYMPDCLFWDWPTPTAGWLATVQSFVDQTLLKKAEDMPPHEMKGA